MCNACYQRWRYQTKPEVAEAARAKRRKWRQENPELHAAAARKWYQENRETAMARNRARYSRSDRRVMTLSRYGMTPGEFEDLLAKQGGCAICGITRETGPVEKHKQFAVDHDHVTNTNRGILCQRCNRALGLLSDDRELLAKAIAYLDQHRENERR